MKKFFLLSALALGAITMSAQIELVGTIPTLANAGNTRDCSIHQPLPTQCLISCDTAGSLATVKLFDPSNLSVMKTITKTISVGSKGEYYTEAMYACKNLYSTDGKFGFYFHSYGPNDTINAIIDEDGNTIKELNRKTYLVGFYEFEGNFYMLCYIRNVNVDWSSNWSMEVYSLPGNGQPTDLEAPSAPARTSNVRKVVENGQMYIILDGVKYAVTGSTTL